MQNNQQGGASNFINGVLAIGLSVLVAPPIFNLTMPYVHSILQSQYGHEIADFGVFGHIAFVGVLTYSAMNRALTIIGTVIVTAINRFIWRLPF